MIRYARSEGLRLESLGETWAVFSPRSGDTLQLNTEAAAVLEVLAEGPFEMAEVTRQLAEASDTDVVRVAAQLDELWPQLIALGFVVAA